MTTQTKGLIRPDQRRAVVLLVTLVAAVWSIWVLEGARKGVSIDEITVGRTPVTVMQRDLEGPAVVVAHGFAGSRQMMQGYGLVLAQAGYRVYAFDFEGHGRHPVPMSGDVTKVEGTTRLLMDQTQQIMEATRSGDEPVALLGHSMATDVLVRVAKETQSVGPVVLVSAFSNEISENTPKDMLLITGNWEPGLSDFAERVTKDALPEARRAVLIAPAVEHVAILHSRAGRSAALEWINKFYNRTSVAAVPQSGWALLVLLTAITLLFTPLARFLPQTIWTTEPLRNWQFLTVVATPMIAAPLLAPLIDFRALPVLVADYLALHLMIFGAVQIALLWRFRGAPAWPKPFAVLLLLVWTLGVFGFVLDRYGANFWPIPERFVIIAALALGSVPFMLADSWFLRDAPLWQRFAARIGFLASLAIAVALDFEGLFFVIMIAPVIVLFYLSFGVMGRVVAQRSGPSAAGVGLGLALAWALGVSFPMFSAS
ncbi:MAG: alpha/beta fold hydrolase [Pseudomonadota bacterium]